MDGRTMNEMTASRSALLPAALAGALFLLGACAGREIPRPDGIGQYQSAVVEVTATTDGGRRQASALQNLIIDELRQEAVFERVAPADVNQEGLLIRATISDLQRVSNLRRIDLGRIAGSNEITVDIELIDLEAERPLSAFRLVGVSPSRAPISPEWPWGSVEQAARQVANRLVHLLEGWVTHPPH